jgi:hypothetical protein
VQEALRVVFQDEEKPNVFLFTTEDDAGLEPFKAGVQSVRGKMVTARFQAKDFEEAFKHFGMDKFVKDGSLPKVYLFFFCMDPFVKDGSLYKVMEEEKKSGMW